jgi:hypothetical protein
MGTSNSKGSAVSFMTQQSMLLQREINSMIRNPAPMIANVCITAVLALIFGIIFFGVGREDRTNFLVSWFCRISVGSSTQRPNNSSIITWILFIYLQVVQAQLGAVVNVLMSVMMGQSQTALLTFSSDRPVFLREYATNHYTILPYFLSKLVAEVISSFAAVVVLVLITYYMIGIQMNIFIFFLISYTLALTTTAVCVLLGSACTDPKIATAFFPLVIVPQFYFSGVFIATELIPNWVRYVSLHDQILE